MHDTIIVRKETKPDFKSKVITKDLIYKKPTKTFI